MVPDDFAQRGRLDVHIEQVSRLVVLDDVLSYFCLCEEDALSSPTHQTQLRFSTKGPEYCDHYLLWPTQDWLVINSTGSKQRSAARIENSRP